MYYSFFIPIDILQEEKPELAKYFSTWNSEDSLTNLRKDAAMQIFNNAVSLLRSGHLRSGEVEMLAAINLGMDSLRVYEFLGQYTLQHKELSKAEHYYKKCLQIDNTKQGNLFGLYLIYFLMSDKDNMETMISKLIETGLDKTDIKQYTDQFIANLGGLQ